MTSSPTRRSSQREGRRDNRGRAEGPIPSSSTLVKIPASNGSIAPVLEVVPLQLLAYSMATERKNDPDYPRNLAKSVTVK